MKYNPETVHDRARVPHMGTGQGDELKPINTTQAEIGHTTSHCARISNVPHVQLGRCHWSKIDRARATVIQSFVPDVRSARDLRNSRMTSTMCTADLCRVRLSTLTRGAPGTGNDVTTKFECKCCWCTPYHGYKQVGAFHSCPRLATRKTKTEANPTSRLQSRGTLHTQQSRSTLALRNRASRFDQTCAEKTKQNHPTCKGSFENHTWQLSNASLSDRC
mmetsp:Transcript_105078/g.302100  ORF Transcript_105078/g.302100 Transcript_105078/m.302100 type:complete len:219 (-) Transcript_105078:15-671(-)